MASIPPSPRAPRVLLPGIAVVALVGCAADEGAPADGIWDVTVASAVVENNGNQALDTTCIGEDEAARTYNDSFEYSLFYDGEAVQIEVDKQAFAGGTRAGCSLSYESSMWLEDRAGGRVTWYVEGYATYRGTAGGCDNQIDEGLDWQGTETIIVVESEDEAVPVGCEYNLVTSGTVVSGG